MKKYTALGLKLSVVNFVEKGVSGSVEPDQEKFVTSVRFVTKLLAERKISQ